MYTQWIQQHYLKPPSHLETPHWDPVFFGLTDFTILALQLVLVICVELFESTPSQINATDFNFISTTTPLDSTFTSTMAAVMVGEEPLDVTKYTTIRGAFPSLDAQDRATEAE